MLNLSLLLALSKWTYIFLTIGVVILVVALVLRKRSQ